MIALCAVAIAVHAAQPQRDLGPLVVAQWVSASCIAFSVRDPFRGTPPADPGAWRVVQNGRRIPVTRVSHETRLIDLIPTGWPYKPVKRHLYYLHLARAADEAHPVRIWCRGPGGRATLEPLRIAAALCLQVDSIGYQPDDGRKLCMMGAWTGTGGPLALGAVTAGVFNVIDLATGSNVFSGVPALSATNDAESGCMVYALDFTPVRQPGRYRIGVPGVGYSAPFAVDPQVNRPVLTALLRLLYHQRCGIAIRPPYTTHSHAACHRSPALLVDIYHSLDDVMKELPKHVVKPRRTIDGWGGWHDAGDYDRAGWHIFVATSLLDAYDAFPFIFADGDSNIPESTNGIPDILDEVRWGLEWFKRMQDPADGGLYYRVETVNYGHCMPEEDAQQLYAMAKYPKYTMWFAAGAAQAARILKPFIPPDEHADLIARAENAYQYGRGHGAPDEAVAGAAAELYLAGAGQEYHNAFLSTHTRQSWSYAVAPSELVDSNAQQACRTSFIGDAINRAKAYAAHVYPCGSGGVANGAGQDSAAFARAWTLTRDPVHLAPARMAVHAQLGLNAMRRCWITGLGIDPPEEVTHAPSTAARRVVPGIPVFGPRRLSASTGSTHARLLWEVSEPKPYPWMRLWAPIWEIPSVSEFTVRDVAQTVFGYAALCAAGTGPAVAGKP